MDCWPPSRVLFTPGAFNVTVVLRVSRDLADSAARLEEEVLYAVRLAGGNQADRTGPDCHRRKRRKTPCDAGGRVGTVFEGSVQTVPSVESCGRKGVASSALVSGRYSELAVFDARLYIRVRRSDEPA